MDSDKLIKLAADRTFWLDWIMKCDGDHHHHYNASTHDFIELLWRYFITSAWYNLNLPRGPWPVVSSWVRLLALFFCFPLAHLTQKSIGRANWVFGNPAFLLRQANWADTPCSNSPASEVGFSRWSQPKSICPSCRGSLSRRPRWLARGQRHRFYSYSWNGPGNTDYILKITN